MITLNLILKFESIHIIYYDIAFFYFKIITSYIIMSYIIIDFKIIFIKFNLIC